MDDHRRRRVAARAEPSGGSGRVRRVGRGAGAAGHPGYDEGLFNRHHRTVVFDQVIDVELTEERLQQTRGAGTVMLVTQQLVSGTDGKLSNRRVALMNVQQPHEVYDLVRSLALKKPGA